LAASRTFCTAGSNNATSTPMMAITTNNSIRVNPDFPRRRTMVTSHEKKNWHKAENRSRQVSIHFFERSLIISTQIQ
jgi:hypothetical protein